MTWSEWQTVEGDGFEFEEIVYEKKWHEELEGGMARVSFDRPDRRNAMTLSTVDEMFRAFYDANHDTSIGVIVVAARGKHFGVGGDVEWEKWGLREAFYNRYPHNRLIRLSRKPILAAVHGYCLGGHNHMAYCCDFTIAAHDAVFGQAGPRVSSPADGFFVPYLTKVVGAKRAREMWMLCRRYPAEKALQMGLVNEVVPSEALMPTALRWAEALCRNGPLAMRTAKEIAVRALDLEPGFVLEKALGARVLASEDAREGPAAFVEKRKPRFRGR